MPTYEHYDQDGRVWYTQEPDVTNRFATPTDDNGYEGQGDFLIIDPAYFFAPDTLPEEPPSHAMIGMAVHYVARGSLDGVFPPVDRACIIAAIDANDPWTIQGVVLNPQGIFFDTLRHNGEWGEPGTWHFAWEILEPEEPDEMEGDGTGSGGCDGGGGAGADGGTYGDDDPYVGVGENE